VSDPVTLRQLKAADIPLVREVALQAWQFTYRTIFDEAFIQAFIARNYSAEALGSLLPRLEAGTMCFDVAEDQTGILGFCNMGMRGGSAELFRIYVLPERIGRGIGRQLLGAGEKFLSAHGVQTYFCMVQEQNELGKAFYLRNGFKHLAEQDHDHEWRMQKELTGAA
jgi:ribosomal protein S18 acetylase RimI-like enzyme